LGIGVNEVVDVEMVVPELVVPELVVVLVVEGDE
jgi:hypothetical protein